MNLGEVKCAQQLCETCSCIVLEDFLQSLRNDAKARANCSNSLPLDEVELAEMKVSV